MHPFILITALFLAAADSTTVTLEEFFTRQCNNGNQTACERQAELAADRNVQKQLESRAGVFWEEVNTDLLMLDGKRPDLQAAYPLVMRDYVESEQAAGNALELKEERLPECARHYHNHWINKKLWYPSHDDGSPDWPAIYVFIVDHYFGYCMRSAASG